MEPDYVIYLDGGFTGENPHKLAVAAVVCTPDYEVLLEVARHAGEGSSNVAEYRALAHAVCMANLVGARQPMFISDSMLVVQQINSMWALNGKPSDQLVREHSRCASALMRFDRWSLKHVRRERNKRADWLVSGLLGHKRTLKNPPGVEPVDREGDGRPGWSQVPSSRRRTAA